MKKHLVCFLFFLLIVFFTNPILIHANLQFPQASEGQVNEALQKIVPLRFLPSNPFYFLILSKENTLRFLKPSCLKKAEFDFILSGKRLKEAYLLIKKDDVKNTSKSLAKYSKKIDKLIDQLEKANSQNQDATKLVFEIAEGLKQHEVLFSVISKKQSDLQLSFNKTNKMTDFDKNFQEAILSYTKLISKIDSIKPGLKDRFKIATDSAALEN